MVADSRKLGNTHCNLPPRGNHRGTKVKNIYSVYDVKAEAFLQPFFEQSDGLAIRAFQEAANNQEHAFCRYAEDFQLFRIGTWNEHDGTIDTLKSHEPLGLALTFKHTNTQHQIAAMMNGQGHAEDHKTGE